MLPPIIAELIAKTMGCALNEGSSNECIVLGIDIGDVLYSMFVMFWLSLISIPIGVIGILSSIIFFVIVFFRGSNES